MTFNTVLAFPEADRERAVAALRDELRRAAAGACAGAPDWSTLVVHGPTEVDGASGRPRYVWVGTAETVLA